MEQKCVYVVIVNWNGLDYTVSCIDSLKNLEYKNIKIIVVDNASSESIDPLNERFPDVYIVRSKENLGFAGGNNLGINYALDQNADIIWLLNNDTLVKSNSLNIMVDKLLSEDDIGIVCPKIYYYDNPKTIWYGGGRILWPKGVTQHCGQFSKESPMDVSNISEVDFATGCSMLIKRNVFEKVGLLNEEYFLYFEDTDFCCKTRKGGYKIVYTNKAVIWHKVSASTSKNAMKDYYFTRNNLYFMFRHSPKKYYITFILFFIKRNFPYLLWILTSKNSEKRKRANSFFKGIIHFLKRIKGPIRT